MTGPRAGQARPKVIWGLQVLRGVAAVLVLLRHSAKAAVGAPLAASAFAIGQIGVDVFFVISGIVIYLTSRTLPWHVFLRRRIARIVPLYWLVLGTAAVLSLARRADAYRLSNFAASFFFLPSHDSPGTVFPPIVAGWTLNFEMYFYAICCLVLLFAPRRLFLPAVSLAVAAGIALGIPLLWGAGLGSAPAPAVLLLPIAAEFVAGLWIARAWESGWRTPLWANVLLVVGAVAWLSFAHSAIMQPYTLARPLWWGVPAAALVWVTLSLEERVPFRRWRPLLLLGDASYAIYITHTITLAVVDAVLLRAHLALGVGAKLVLLAAAAIAVGLAVHLLVELRLVRWAGRLLGLVPGRTAVAALHSAETPALAGGTG